MRASRPFTRFIVLARRVTALVGLGLALLSGSSVQARDNPPAFDSVTLYPTGITQLCVGQQAFFNGAFHTGLNPLASLTGGPAPVSEISIDSTASRGSLSPAHLPVDYGLWGAFSLSYQAQDEGTVVIQSALGGRTSNPIVFQVKVCDYDYTLSIDVHYSFTVAPNLQLAETYHFNAGGVLKPINPQVPLSDLRDEAAQLTYTGQLDSFKLPAKAGVTIDKQSYQPAEGSAPASAHAEFGPGGATMNFYMLKGELNSQSSLKINITRQGKTEVAPFADDLEKEIFDFFNQHANQPEYRFVGAATSSSGGVKNVIVPDLDQVCQMFKIAPGFKCSYTAIVTLKLAEE